MFPPIQSRAPLVPGSARYWIVGSLAIWVAIWVASIGSVLLCEMGVEGGWSPASVWRWKTLHATHGKCPKSVRKFRLGGRRRRGGGKQVSQRLRAAGGVGPAEFRPSVGISGHREGSSPSGHPPPYGGRVKVKIAARHRFRPPGSEPGSLPGKRPMAAPMRSPITAPRNHPSRRPRPAPGRGPLAHHAPDACRQPSVTPDAGAAEDPASDRSSRPGEVETCVPISGTYRASQLGTDQTEPKEGA